MKDTLARNAIITNRHGTGKATLSLMIDRALFQLLGGLLVAVYLPVFARWQFDLEIVASPSVINTIAGAALAVVTGFFHFRSLSTYPGVRSLSYLVPAFIVAFTAVLIIFFFMRLDYSRFQFGASFILSIIWFYGINITVGNARPYRLAVVPGGQASSLRSHEKVTFSHLHYPRLVGNGWGGIVADLRTDMDDEWERFLTDCAISGIPVFHVKQIRESLTGRVEIEHLSENHFGSLIPNLAYVNIKQWIDWLVALIVLPLLLPLFAIVAILIKWDSPGPVLFVQQRMGYQGRCFKVYKFRTMTVERPGADKERDGAITKSGDQRITDLGRFLRKTRIDELPQIFNILRGEMSWIGPRPEAVVLSSWYENELAFYRYRHIVRPGITGWAQVNQGHVAAVDQVLEKLHYDFYYIKYFSPWLDVLIAFRTVHTMVTGFGAR